MAYKTKTHLLQKIDAARGYEAPNYHWLYNYRDPW